jgi:hypothetical protein
MMLRIPAGLEQRSKQLELWKRWLATTRSFLALMQVMTQ